MTHILIPRQKEFAMPKMTSTIICTLEAPDGTSDEHMALLHKHWHVAFDDLLPQAEAMANSDHATRCADTGDTPVPFTLSGHIAVAILHD